MTVDCGVKHSEVQRAHSRVILVVSHIIKGIINPVIKPGINEGNVKVNSTQGEQISPLNMSSTYVQV